ncbi:hypothetical protein [Cupriavidus campinensis]|uniref:hypothetical protein n=1 Tax=Cupriavidus campinensis TaxID=151783 RepID=UPI001C90FBD5|nr:hypothetical protein [Cupriavidus campinensis]
MYEVVVSGDRHEHAGVKTDLVYPNLQACLVAESEMRQLWADSYNTTVKLNPSPESMKWMQTQMTRGTCIPTKG